MAAFGGAVAQSEGRLARLRQANDHVASFSVESISD